MRGGGSSGHRRSAASRPGIAAICQVGVIVRTLGQMFQLRDYYRITPQPGSPCPYSYSPFTPFTPPPLSSLHLSLHPAPLLFPPSYFLLLLSFPLSFLFHLHFLAPLPSALSSFPSLLSFPHLLFLYSPLIISPSLPSLPPPLPPHHPAQITTEHCLWSDTAHAVLLPLPPSPLSPPSVISFSHGGLTLMKFPLRSQ